MSLDSQEEQAFRVHLESLRTNQKTREDLLTWLENREGDLAHYLELLADITALDAEIIRALARFSLMEAFGRWSYQNKQQGGPG